MVEFTRITSIRSITIDNYRKFVNEQKKYQLGRKLIGQITEKHEKKAETLREKKEEIESRRREYGNIESLDARAQAVDQIRSLEQSVAVAERTYEFTDS